ncbi:MAG: aminopeptidase P family protein [Christensenella sp.]
MSGIIEKIRNLGTADAYLLSSVQNVTYATNFSGDCSQLLITSDNAYFFTDFRYEEQAKHETADVEIIITGGDDRLVKIGECIANSTVHTLAIEKDDVSVKIFEGYKKTFKPCDYVDVTDDLLLMRMIKTEYELEKIKKAAKSSETALQQTLPFIRQGISELDVRAELEYRMQMQGMGLAFPTIVAAGTNSAMPHHTPSSYILQAGDFVTIDFGCKFEGYCSDMTRTFAIGNVDGEQKKIYDVVRCAQEAASDIAAIGADTFAVDAKAREIIAENGYGAYYEHGTGHGVGLLIHELPVLNPRSRRLLEKNMVFTVEPGVYVPNVGGVRIEDMHIGGVGSVYEFTKNLILL